MKKGMLWLFACLLLNMVNMNAQKELLFNPDQIDIPYEKFVLDNGLTLIVHEDHKAPIAAVNVWYHVGSKNEKPGKSGFAHLFEHLMFNGSEHFNDDYFQALQGIGATDLNGTTNNDRTNYFQNVPTAGLDQVLFLESDRMGHLLGAIDQAKLDEQRGVVQNEKRQGENQPYGRQYDLLTKAMFPKGHPYSWTVIGSMEDLNAASLEDVHEWFKTYYGPDNAVICIAGDVEAEKVYKKVVKYFGNIPAGPTLSRQEVNIPIRPADTRQSYEDRVPESRITIAWNTPELTNKQDAHFDLIASIMSSGKNSRLYKKLVYEEQVASSANAFQWSKELCSNFMVQVNVKPGEDVAEVEAMTRAILDEFLENGPTEEELYRAKNAVFANFIKGMERIGGFGGKSDILARSMVYGGTPDGYKTWLSQIEEATAKDLKKAANQWLATGSHTLICTPFPEYSTTGEELDRSKLPELMDPTPAKFPDLEKARLSNGLQVVLARREGVPTMVMNMMFDAGYAADQFATPGTAALAMDMMDEGTEEMSALEINEKLQLMGASIGAYSDLDASYVTMNTLKPSLDPSLDLYADVILSPAFPKEEFERLKKQQLAKIEREKSTPVQMAMRVFPKFLYGTGHAYSLPMTGSGYASTVQNLAVEDMKAFYNQWIHPNNATLTVVGDITMDELLPALEKRFGQWKKGKSPKKNIAKVKDENSKKLYLMDRPESLQSVIIAGYLTEPYGDVSEIAAEVMNNVLGGQFISRVNMNLREDKHWAYGARTMVLDAKGQRPLMVYAPVQTDKTSESVTEIIKEFNQFVGEKPVTKEEFEKNQNNTVLGLPGRWETNRSVASSIVEIMKYDLPEDYYQKYDGNVRNLTLKEVHEVSDQMVHPDKLTWFIVGDKKEVLPKLEALDFDEIILVDPDGHPVKEVKASGP